MHGGYFGRGVKGDVAIRAYLEAKNLSVTTADFTMAMERLRTAARPAGSPPTVAQVAAAEDAEVKPAAQPQPTPQPNPTAQPTYPANAAGNPAATPAAAPAATIPVNPQNTANLGFTVGQPQTPQQPNPQAFPQPNPPPLVYLATGNPLSIELPPELAKKPIGQVIAALKSEHGSAHNLGHRPSLSDSISVARAIRGAHTFSDAEANVISAVMRVREGFQGRSFCSVI